MSVVAIDGPAGAGKSTIARRLARVLGWAYLDTGAMYRALTHVALSREIPLDDEAALAHLAGDLALRLAPSGVVRVDGEDVTAHLRREAVNAAVSRVAAVPAVRSVMVGHQRRFAADNPRVVAEGRDIGTVVFPEADVKIWLDAAPRERARRRQAEQGGSGGDVEAVLAAIERRDAEDRSREVAPARPAADARRIDTSEMTLDEVFEAVRSQVQSAIRP